MFRNKYNSEPSFTEDLTCEYLTSPDGTLSIKEILRRQMAGLPIPPNTFNEVQYSPDFIPPYAKKGFDLADTTQVIRNGSVARQELEQQTTLTKEDEQQTTTK